MTTSELSLFHMAVMQAWNAVVITSADAATGYPVETANPAFCKMTGYTLDELKGSSLKMLQGPDTDQAVLQRLRTCLREALYFEGMTTNYRKDGTAYIVRWNISPVRDNDGVLTHFVSVQQDMTDYVRSEQKGRMLAKALDAASDPVLLTDARAKIVFLNQAFAKTTGYQVDELVGKTPAIFRSGEHDEQFYQGLRHALESGTDFKANFINRRRDGSLYHTEQNISPLRDDTGQITHYISVSRDITERIEQERVLRQAATQDKLTGLYNRHAGEKLLTDSYASAKAQEHALTLIICDIDHFKKVNDQYGHPTGDAVIRNVASALRRSVRDTDAVIRWGGEEFMVILTKCDAAQAIDLAERMRANVAGYADTQVGQVTISLGLATLQTNEALDALIARSDQALYQSKRAGRNRLTVA